MDATTILFLCFASALAGASVAALWRGLADSRRRVREIEQREADERRQAVIEQIDRLREELRQDEKLNIGRFSDVWKRLLHLQGQIDALKNAPDDPADKEAA